MHFNRHPGYECFFVHVCIADMDALICTTLSLSLWLLTSLLHYQLEYERYLLVPQQGLFLGGIINLTGWAHCVCDCGAL